MAGFSKLYVIGGLGGYLGADGVNPILLQIWVGDADRQWLQRHRVDPRIKRLGAIRRIIPNRPNDPVALVDACIAFFPQHFQQCPSLEEAAAVLQDTECLDFDQGKDEIPPIWFKLRQEAKAFMGSLAIFEAELKRVEFNFDELTESNDNTCR